MAGIRTCDRESQVQRPNHYTTEPPLSDDISRFTVPCCLVMWQMPAASWPDQQYVDGAGHSGSWSVDRH